MSLALIDPPPPDEAFLDDPGLYFAVDEVNGFVDVYVGPPQCARDYAADVERVNRTVASALRRRRLLVWGPALLARARQRRSTRTVGRAPRRVSRKKRHRHRSSDDPDLTPAHSEPAQACVPVARGRAGALRGSVS